MKESLRDEHLRWQSGFANAEDSVHEPTIGRSANRQMGARTLPGALETSVCDAQADTPVVRSGKMVNTLSGVIGDIHGRGVVERCHSVGSDHSFCGLPQTDRFTITELCEESKIRRYACFRDSVILQARARRSVPLQFR